jgi:pyrroline-5-carboxylate reductase
LKSRKIAILGAGNIGTAIARGLMESGNFAPGDIVLTRRKLELLDEFKVQGFEVEGDNKKAVAAADIIIVAVEPRQVDGLLEQIGRDLDPGRHILISVVTGVKTEFLAAHIAKDVPVVRAMPNTAIAVRQSMTCLAGGQAGDQALQAAKSIFDTVGETLIIDEEQMVAATALGACGIAFFLRAIRAASQGGIEIGFHSQEALAISAQTALGAATLMRATENHPEFEIDKVTTPRGCTIAGVNQMEHAGFSSAMIKGITVSAEKAAGLHTSKDK